MLHTPVVPVNIGFSYGSRLDVALARAEAALGFDVPFPAPGL